MGALAGPLRLKLQTADQTQPPGGTVRRTAGPVTTVNQAVDRIIAREHDEIATIRHYNPIIETYIQDMRPDKEWVRYRSATTISSDKPTFQGRGRQLDDRRRKGKAD